MADRTRSGRPFAGLASIRARLTAAACLVVAGALIVGAAVILTVLRHTLDENLDDAAVQRAKDVALQIKTNTLEPTLPVHGDEDALHRGPRRLRPRRGPQLQPDAGPAGRHLPSRGRRPGDPHPEDPGARGGGRLPDRGAQRPGAGLRRGHDLRRRQPRPRQGDRDGRAPPPALGGAAAGRTGRGDRLVRRRTRAAPGRGDAGRGSGDHGAGPGTARAGAQSARRDRAPGHHHERHARPLAALGRARTAIRGRRVRTSCRARSPRAWPTSRWRSRTRSRRSGRRRRAPSWPTTSG